MSKLIITLGILIFTLISCGDKKSNEVAKTTNASESSTSEMTNSMQNKGIGPITEVVLDDKIDEKMAAEGEKIYKEKCSACHKPYKKYIGPAPVGVLNRRSPEWIMNMILNPEVMLKEDPIAKQLLKQYTSPMANQNLTEEEARKILEYFRTLKEN